MNNPPPRLRDGVTRAVGPWIMEPWTWDLGHNVLDLGPGTEGTKRDPQNPQRGSWDSQGVAPPPLQPGTTGLLLATDARRRAHRGASRHLRRSSVVPEKKFCRTCEGVPMHQ